MPDFSTLSPEVKSKLLDYFVSQPVGTMLKSGESIELVNNRVYLLKNDYLKLEKDIYALANGRGAVLGEGSFGKVICIRSLTSGAELVMKIIPFYSSEQQLAELANELRVLYDLGLYRDGGTYHHGAESTQYLVMINAGLSLDKFIRLNPQLPIEARLDLAIQLCWLVHKLHQGLSSRGLVAYVHRDLKPANLALSESGTLRLIDLGLATEKPDSLPHTMVGAPAYLPNIPTFLNVPVNLRQLDILALKRVIYMPNKLFCHVGFKEDLTKKHFDLQMLLPQKALKHYKLFEHFDTSAHGGKRGFVLKSQFSGEPLIMASLLVLARYSLLDSLGSRMQNPLLAAAVLGMYFAYEGSPDALVKGQMQAAVMAYVLCRVAPRHQALAEQVRLFALFVSLGVSNNLHAAVAESSLIAFIKNSPSPLITHAAALLWQQGIYQANLLTQLNSKECAATVIQLLFDGDKEAVLRMLIPKERVKTQERRLSLPSLFAKLPKAEEHKKETVSARASVLDDESSEFPQAFFAVPRPASERICGVRGSPVAKL